MANRKPYRPAMRPHVYTAWHREAEVRGAMDGLFYADYPKALRRLAQAIEAAEELLAELRLALLALEESQGEKRRPPTDGLRH